MGREGSGWMPKRRKLQRESQTLIECRRVPENAYSFVVDAPPGVCVGATGATGVAAGKSERAERVFPQRRRAKRDRVGSQQGSEAATVRTRLRDCAGPIQSIGQGRAFAAGTKREQFAAAPHRGLGAHPARVFAHHEFQQRAIFVQRRREGDD